MPIIWNENGAVDGYILKNFAQTVQSTPSAKTMGNYLIPVLIKTLQSNICLDDGIWNM